MSATASRLSRRQRTIPAFAPVATDGQGGDDLARARDFIERAVGAMRDLRTDNPVAITEWLTQVEKDARALQARAIQRAVIEARALAVLGKAEEGLHTVGTLIAQYEGGLVDIEAQQETLRGEPLPELAPPVKATPDLADKYADVRATLHALLDRVDAGPHMGALKTLTEAPLDVEADVDATADEPHRPIITGPAFDVEPLLPGLVDHAHRSARMIGKKLTASYAARDARLPATLAEDWQTAAETAITALVTTTLETAPDRQARGETAAAHMALTVEGTPDGLSLILRCPGTQIPDFSVDAPHSLKTRVDNDLVFIEFLARFD